MGIDYYILSWGLIGFDVIENIPRFPHYFNIVIWTIPTSRIKIPDLPRVRPADGITVPCPSYRANCADAEMSNLDGYIKTAVFFWGGTN